MENRVSFDTTFRFRAPTGMLSQIETAAARRCMKLSEYVRHAVSSQLERDGLGEAPETVQ